MIAGRDDNPAVPAPRWLSSASYASNGASAGPAEGTGIPRAALRDDTPAIENPRWLSLGGKVYAQEAPEPSEGDLLIGGEDLLIGGEGVTF